jgi:hypothetical protein
MEVNPICTFHSPRCSCLTSSLLTVSDVLDLLTVEYSSAPGQAARRALKRFVQSKCHPLLFDACINSPLTVAVNTYQLFLFAAIKFAAYLDQVNALKTASTPEAVEAKCNFIHGTVFLLYAYSHPQLTICWLRFASDCIQDCVTFVISVTRSRLKFSAVHMTLLASSEPASELFPNPAQQESLLFGADLRPTHAVSAAASTFDSDMCPPCHAHRSEPGCVLPPAALLAVQSGSEVSGKPRLPKRARDSTFDVPTAKRVKTSGSGPRVDRASQKRRFLGDVLSLSTVSTSEPETQTSLIDTTISSDASAADAHCSRSAEVEVTKHSSSGNSRMLAESSFAISDPELRLANNGSSVQPPHRHLHQSPLQPAYTLW